MLYIHISHSPETRTATPLTMEKEQTDNVTKETK
jgi:hypothetical protein